MDKAIAGGRQLGDRGQERKKDLLTWVTSNRDRGYIVVGQLPIRP
jgi:hypothetical protein